MNKTKLYLQIQELEKEKQGLIDKYSDLAVKYIKLSNKYEEKIELLLANKQAISDLKDKYDRLDLDYVEMRSSLNKELLEHKAIIKYLEGKIK